MNTHRREAGQPTFQGFILAAFDNTVELLGSNEHPSNCLTLTESAKLLMREMRPPNEAAIKSRLLKCSRE